MLLLSSMELVSSSLSNAEDGMKNEILWDDSEQSGKGSSS
jgi:hypothetical protein